NLLVGVWKESLIARVGKDAYEAALREVHVKEFDVTGKPMKGWVMVEPDGIDSDHQLNQWTDQAMYFVRTLQGK
ncbi:MAG: hypothetical protein KDB01_01155, partial [Planctomycetaceae bacterium]|nr:hypothetical protein [Planctomycetaceae bacterium]